MKMVDSRHALGFGVAAMVGILSGQSLAASTTPPFVFTGHWTGSAVETGSSPTALAADFTMNGTRAFMGTVDVQTVPVDSCTAKGHANKKMKVTMRLKCADGSKIKLHGDLDPTTDTIQGTFNRTKHGKHHTGTFTLAEQPTG